MNKTKPEETIENNKNSVSVESDEAKEEKEKVYLRFYHVNDYL